jgi:phage gpG-like protein
MPAILSFSIAGDNVLLRELRGWQIRAVDARPAFELMADAFGDAETRQFDSEGAYGSGGWAPLSPSYAAWKDRHYPGKPILERSGALRHALTQRPFGIEHIQNHFAEFGIAANASTGPYYGQFHQEGTDKMPARPVVAFPESLKREFVKIMQEWLVGGAGERVAL